MTKDCIFKVFANSGSSPIWLVLLTGLLFARAGNQSASGRIFHLQNSPEIPLVLQKVPEAKRAITKKQGRSANRPNIFLTIWEISVYYNTISGA